MARVLVADDDHGIRTAVRRALILDGHDVVEAADGREALAAMLDGGIDGVVLDVNMPHVDGLEVCRRLRSADDRTPVLMLTARDDIEDRVAGLDAGADDYVVKPFAVVELQARVRALLRRGTANDAAASPPEEQSLSFAHVVLNLDTRELQCGGDTTQLSRIEFALLEMLLRNPRRVLTRELIHEQVWGFAYATSSNSLEVYVGYLRRKLERDAAPRIIHTVRGVGYVLKEAAA